MAAATRADHARSGCRSCLAPTVCSTPRRRADTSTSRRAGCSHRAGATTRSARPVTRAMPRSACCRAWMTLRCSTTAPVASTPRGPASPGSTDPVRDILLSLTVGRATRCQADATRSSATRRCTSSRRPRPSARICPGRSGWPTPSASAATRASSLPGPRTRSSSAASVTPPRTTRRPPERSTPPPTWPTATCPALSCSCARTTASGSAPGPRAAGRRRRSSAFRGFAYWHVDGADPESLLPVVRTSLAAVRRSRRARRAPPAHRSVHGPRRLGRGDRLPLPQRDPRRLRARPAPRVGLCAGRPGRHVAGRSPGPLRGRPAGGHGRGQARARRGTARQQGRGHGPARPPARRTRTARLAAEDRTEAGTAACPSPGRG